MVETTGKRKTYPQKIKSNLVKQYNSDLNQLAQCRFNLTEFQLNWNTSDVCTIEQDVIDRARTAFSSLASLSKSASMLVDRGERLEKSYRLYKTLAHCPTHQALQSPGVAEGHKMTASVTPPKLTQPCRTPHTEFTTGEALKPCNLLQPPPHPCQVERTDYMYKDISSFKRRSTRSKPTG
ncbi:uncharacterized protein LOC135466681 isoform X2 [Liolophura sinensis]